MKQFFTILSTNNKKSFRFILLLLILLVALPVLETPQAEAQTTKTGNFFTRRFTRTHKFNRKAKNSTAFQRKPFSCEDIGKTKVEQVKVSKKQLRRWEEERLVKAEQEKAKEQRVAKTENNKAENKEEEIIISASSENDMEEIASKKNNISLTKNTTKKSVEKNSEVKEEKNVVKEEENTERRGWYSSEKADAPKISPIVINQKNEITNQKNKQELEIAAKHSRLGYTIVLESNNEKQLETVKNYLISIGTQEETIKLNASSTNQNEVNIKIEK